MRYIFTLLAVVFLVPACIEAQTVTLDGTVSETVALSVGPTFTHSNMDVVRIGGNTVRITISGDHAKSPVMRVPLLVRSNSGFKISAVVESQTAELTHFSVIDVRPTGTLVSPEVVNALVKLPEGEPDLSQPLLVLSGPRVSLGGTLESPNNALQITLLIRMKPQPVSGWLVHLTFVATAESLVQ
jgi:hypothetical protein